MGEAPISTGSSNDGNVNGSSRRKHIMSTPASHRAKVQGRGGGGGASAHQRLSTVLRFALFSFAIYYMFYVGLVVFFHTRADLSSGSTLLDKLKADYLPDSVRKYEEQVEDIVGPLVKNVGGTLFANDDNDNNDDAVVGTRRKNKYGEGKRDERWRDTRKSDGDTDEEETREDEEDMSKSELDREGREMQSDSGDKADTDAKTGTAAKESTDRKFTIDKSAAESYLSTHGPENLRQTLSAYVEPPLHDRDTSVPYYQGEAKDKNTVGNPPKFLVPLPLRTHGPDALHKFEYPKLQTCNDVPGKMPVDEGLLLNGKGEHIIPNVNNRQPIVDAMRDAEYCPVNADPFLPWVHDVFPSPNGRTIHFIAQNKRRCNTGNRFLKDLEMLEPQVAIMQAISVERIDDDKAEELAPDLWSPGSDEGTSTADDDRQHTSRYRLAPHEESDPDGHFTRFICRFHQTSVDDGDEPRTTIIGETLSTFPMNYELANYRKAMPSYGSMLTPKGKDNAQFWLSNFRFDCPVPNIPGLAKTIASGGGILSDGTPLIHVDVVPIRTSPRFGVQEVYFTDDLAGPKSQYGHDIGDKFRWTKYMGMEPGQFGFDAKKRWGDNNVVPRVEASGRWENFPICRPPPPTLEGEDTDDESKALAVIEADGALDAPTEPKRKKKHDLIACLWASKAYTTRGHENKISDTTERLIEWIEYNLMVGFDHIYIYDNTGAHTDETDLRDTLARFGPSEVTRIEWPYRVCNNNVPAHENTGERSSQHAAESSCRQRYGAHSEWLAAIDPDEYLVPMGNYDNLKDVLRDAASHGTEILGFKSTRAYPITELMLPYHDDDTCGTAEDPKCLQKSPGTLNLELYNCDVETLPKPNWAQRAKKQIYRPSYVLSHYVHYSTITRGLVETCDHRKLHGKHCIHRFKESAPTERFTNERQEAVMIHSKTLVPRDSVDWRERCKPDFKESHGVKCRVGFPVPGYDGKAYGKANEEGMKYNCYSYQKVTDVWVPRLKKAMKKREESFKAAQESA